MKQAKVGPSRKQLYNARAPRRSSRMDLQLGDIIRPGRGQGLDFISLEELRKRTGIAQYEVFEWALNEMLCNSLDTDATIINITVRTEGEFDELTVSDNGSKKIEPEDL